MKTENNKPVVCKCKLDVIDNRGIPTQIEFVIPYEFFGYLSQTIFDWSEKVNGTYSEWKEFNKEKEEFLKTNPQFQYQNK